MGKDAVLSARAALVLGIIVAEFGLVVVEHELLSLGASARHGRGEAGGGDLLRRIHTSLDILLRLSKHLIRIVYTSGSIGSRLEGNLGRCTAKKGEKLDHMDIGFILSLNLSF